MRMKTTNGIKKDLDNYLDALNPILSGEYSCVDTNFMCIKSAKAD